MVRPQSQRSSAECKERVDGAVEVVEEASLLFIIALTGYPLSLSLRNDTLPAQQMT